MDEVWSLVEQSKTKGISLRSAVSADKCGSADYWQSKLLSIYLEKCRIATCGAQHFQIITDGSVHSTQDMLVSVLYMPEVNMAIHLPGQALWASKVCQAEDFHDLDESMQRILARREQTRLTSYKILQGLSHQLEIATSKRVNLSSFDCPDDFTALMKPLTPGEARPMILDGQVYRDGLYYDVLELLRTQGCLSLMLDQSSSDMAAASFLLESGAFVQCDWDFYHRLANDCKLSEAACNLRITKLSTQPLGYVLVLTSESFPVLQWLKVDDHLLDCLC